MAEHVFALPGHTIVEGRKALNTVTTKGNSQLHNKKENHTCSISGTLGLSVWKDNSFITSKMGENVREWEKNIRFLLENSSTPKTHFLISMFSVFTVPLLCV
ncbi:hypothetical protein I3842_Q074400 [Carya illinoinensis]|uniref:Uncharacterized protein n=1 Tax=Carya illinoinensis TaxID=32201 RepID=A0A922A2W4_CARIL|nr:hypothetical protein I3842_Q074400 [Carya illinoinensis]